MDIEKTELQEVYLKRVKALWQASSETFPDFLQEISKSAKIKNQKLAIKYSQSFKDVFKDEELDKDLLDEKISTLLKDEGLFKKSDVFNRESIEKAVLEMKRFLKKVRCFAPEMDIDDIGKAGRNYMVYSVFNILNDVEQACTDAIFGYSMLYPVTDNFLDDPNITPQEKKQYNQFIKEKLMGHCVTPKLGCEKTTFDLLEMVEQDYPRDSGSNIYTVLLCMLDAQIYSLKQQRDIELSQEEIFDISAYKGGVSVLADRMFVKKELVPDEITFYLGLGLILQIGDDLQDIYQDIKDKSQTIMTQKSDDPVRLEKTVNKLFNFIKSIAKEGKAGDARVVEALEKTCCQLVMTSILQSKDYFTKDYLDRIEKYLPVTTEFINEQTKSISIGSTIQDKARYLKIIDQMV